MKLPDVLTGILPKKEEEKEYFFSLYVDRDAAAVGTWSADVHGKPHVSSFAHAVVAQDSWEARIQVIDRLLSAAEDKIGVSKAISKTVFGMPGVYLTHEGDITEAVRLHLKKLTKMLELTPVGFVSLSQAIAFSLKKDEGVPPSVILVGCSGSSAHVTIFRVGNPTHDDTIDIIDDPSAALESVLKKHQDSDVLPSRILLYGGNVSHIEEIRAKLLKHPWPTRTNFLHFPKIEIIPLESLLTSVSLSGASELAHEIGESEEAGGVASTVVAQPSAVNSETTEAKVEESEEVSNVEIVTPETLGFRHEDVLEQPPVFKPQEKLKFSFPVKFRVPQLSFAAFGTIRSFFVSRPKFRGVMLVYIVGVALLIILGATLYYTLPRVTVTILVASTTVDESTAISVDPKATSADATSKMIPGKTLEQSVSGETTIAVTGKKNVGDPAKGSVTIYNKVTSAKTFLKGTQLSSNGVVFTLDSDISIASASESIGSITFGKATAPVTAKDIGAHGNVSASSEFTISNSSSSQVIARNESAFTGGTSKQVTVVSRADQEALVKTLTDQLVGQAKEQLSSSSTSGEYLIDQTIKTEVTEKVFNAELDAEVKELQGKVTITVTGVSVADSDVKVALSELIRAKVPEGYALAPEQTKVTTSNVMIKKDGTITLTAKLTAIALPVIDEQLLKGKLAGRDVTSALSILKETNGVAGAEFRFALTPTKSRLPIRSKNITITVMVP